MNAGKISVEVAQEGDYPGGEEWRGKIKEAIAIMAKMPESSPQWVKVFPIESDVVARARAAARSGILDWGKPYEGTGYKLITRYDPINKIFWMMTELEGVEEEDEEE